MEKTLDDLKELILKNVTDENVTEISSSVIVEEAYPYQGQFFNNNKIYKILRVKNGFNQTLTQFSREEYAQPILDFLNQYASSKLPNSAKQFSFVKKQFPAIPEYLFDIKIDINVNGAITIIRTDTNGKYIFDSFEELIEKVFSEEPNEFTFCADKVGKALLDRYKVAQKSLKTAETTLKNAKIRLEYAKNLYDQVPNSIKLLVEVGEL